MVDAQPRRQWSDCAWRDFGADATRWIAVLPLAATEQHGPHLPLGTDVMIAQAYLDEVEKRLPDAIPATILPVQPIGISTEHRDYPGTLSLAPDVAIASWMALGEAVARAGLRKLVVVTSHGGNSAAMTIVAQELRARHAMLVVTTSWSRFGAPDGLISAGELEFGVHGGLIETSIMRSRWPHLLRMDAVADFPSAAAGQKSQARWLSTNRPAPWAWQAQDLNPAGAVGNASQATAEIGAAMLSHGAQRFCELLDDVDKFDMASLATSPFSSLSI